MHSIFGRCHEHVYLDCFVFVFEESLRSSGPKSDSFNVERSDIFWAYITNNNTYWVTKFHLFLISIYKVSDSKQRFSCNLECGITASTLRHCKVEVFLALDYLFIKRAASILDSLSRGECR